MAKLAKVYVYAIQWLNHKDNTAEQIASELSLTTDQVNKVLEKNTGGAEKSNIRTTSSVVGDKKKNLMITETSGKKNKSVAIMTRDASVRGDDCRKKAPNRNTDKNIFKPRNK